MSKRKPAIVWLAAAAAALWASRRDEAAASAAALDAQGFEGVEAGKLVGRKQVGPVGSGLSGGTPGLNDYRKDSKGKPVMLWEYPKQTGVLRSGYIAARDMTREEARAWLQTLVDGGQITLSESKVFPNRVSLPSTIRGVQCVWDVNGKPLAVHDVEPRLAVLVVRLCTMLSVNFHATKLVHAGAFPGKADTPGHVSTMGNHNRGGGFDIVGVDGEGGGGDVAMVPSAFSVTVLKDWWSLPPIKGAYRIPSGSPAYAVFLAMGMLLRREASDTSQKPNGNKYTSVIGQSSSVLDPDDPDPTLADRHKTHVHCNVGTSYIDDVTG